MSLGTLVGKMSIFPTLETGHVFQTFVSFRLAIRHVHPVLVLGVGDKVFAQLILLSFSLVCR